MSTLIQINSSISDYKYKPKSCNLINPTVETIELCLHMYPIALKSFKNLFYFYKIISFKNFLERE